MSFGQSNPGIALLFLYIALGADAQNKSYTAEQVINSYLEQSGSQKHLDTLFTAYYKSYSITTYTEANPQKGTWKPYPTIKEIETYTLRDGTFVSHEYCADQSKWLYVGLTDGYVWMVEDSALVALDSGHFYNNYQQLTEPCLDLPLRLSTLCSPGLQWTGEEQENGKTYLIISDTSSSTNYWFETETTLLYKEVQTTELRSTVYEDYRQVGRVWVPFKETSYLAGNKTVEITLKSVSYQPDIPAGVFDYTTYCKQ